MIIKSLHLANFRNHTTYDLACTEPVSLIIGPNGCGKTSVLEAIYLLTRGKSFRATDPDIIMHGAAYYRAALEYETGEEVTASYDGNIKTFTAAGHKSRRLPKKHQYPVVLFEPSDLNLISHAPSRRRTYFDHLFAELDPSYSTHLSRYEKALRQRNELLKFEETKPADLFSWNLLLARHGTELVKLRAHFTSVLNEHLTTTYRSIAENADTISLAYASTTQHLTESQYLEKLEHNFPRDHILGHTTLGPHLDDLIFQFNSAPADGSASRGECRSILLALKFIEAGLITAETHLRPLILLDDVFSELDATRRRHLIDNFKDHQIIITSVEEIPHLT